MRTRIHIYIYILYIYKCIYLGLVWQQLNHHYRGSCSAKELPKASDAYVAAKASRGQGIDGQTLKAGVFGGSSHITPLGLQDFPGCS